MKLGAIWLVKMDLVKPLYTTPVSRAFANIVKFLIGKGAPIDIANSAGLTPKQCCVNAACKELFPEE